MKALLLTALMGILPLFVFAQVNKIKDAGPDDKRINFAIVGDGYTAAQLGDYATDCQDIVTDFFNEAPFSNYTNFFNVHTVDVISQESGADHPNIEESTSHPELEVNTALNGRFDAFGIHRLVVVDNALAFAELAVNYPGFDQAIILVNSPFYGGSGGATAVNTLANAASDLALHEVGHSFQGLADEYNSGSNSERANVTSTSNAGNVKWSDWIGTGGVGEFSRNDNTLKPVDGECMMEFLNRPFCPVCVEQTIETIYDKISPLETTTPAVANVDFSGNDLDFAITTIKPIPNTLTYEWELNGQPLVDGTEEVTLTASQLPLSSNTLLVRVTDATTLSMKNVNYVFTYEWTISNQTLPLEWTSFTAQAEGKANRLDWTISQPENVRHFLVDRYEAGRWVSLEQQPFSGANDYISYDESPLDGTNQYRIRSVDYDGTELASPVREVRGINRTYFRAYPSVTDGPVAVEIFTEAVSATHLQIFSAAGREVRTLSLATEGGWLRREVDLTGLIAGTYVVRITAGKEVYTQRIVLR